MMRQGGLSMRKALALAFGLGTMIALAGAEGTALAQKKDPAAKPAAAPAAAPVKPPKQYSFDADEIKGELIKPTGDFTTSRTFAEHGSLIRVRADFVREIVKSAEDL